MSQKSGTWGRRRARARSSLFAIGEPMLWLTGGALALCTLMVAGLLLLVLVRGLGTFWPLPVIAVETLDGRPYMGEVTRDDAYRPEESLIASMPPAIAEQARAQLERGEGLVGRRLLRTGNYRLTQNHFQWVSNYEIARETFPDWAMVLEQMEWGRFYGFPEAFVKIERLETPSPEAARALIAKHPQGSVRLVVGSENDPELRPVEELETVSGLIGVAVLADGPDAAWEGYRQHHAEARERFQKRRRLEKDDTGAVNHRQEQARLAVREAELEQTDEQNANAELEAARQRYEQVRAWADGEFARIRIEIDAINHENSRYQLLMSTAGYGTIPPQQVLVRLDQIVRAYPANRLSWWGKSRLFLARWAEFLADEPREANSEGGVYPAIFGTVVMTLIMSIAVVPFGVLAALFLREYAKAGPLVSSVRIAVNNLAGVPSIVFGVFGLGFFCYVTGASIDELFYAANLPNPTFGKGGLMWAAFTLALLTLPVVIVATEEAVAAVPSSMREGSLACGASKWQTIQRIVLPRALPGIITGMILAIARGAGEVAPLMLVGAVKLAPELPIDGNFPFVHLERSFMHLGFHIYDVGFQSQNSEAAKPMVYTTTLLLIVLIALLNVAAIWLRGRLRKKFASGKF